MFLAVGRSSIFLILNSPLSIFLSYISSKETAIDYYDLIIFTILNSLSYFNYSINLFVHLILNKAFGLRFVISVEGTAGKLSIVTIL